MTITRTDAFEYHHVLKRLADMTTERDALVSVKIALVDKVEALENLIGSMVVECDANMPAKAAWLARRNCIDGDSMISEREAPMPCPGFDSGACVPGKYCGRRMGYAYPCPGQPSLRSTNDGEVAK